MTLQDGAIYSTPDGRQFRARKELREPAWTLVPPGSDEDILRTPTRDRLGQLLFIEDGEIVFFDFSGLRVAVQHTGWTLHDLAPCSSKRNVQE
jgi:hypothetical protein